MYFSASQVLEAINNLNSINPFFGITFLVCKKMKLPIGEKIEFPMDKLTNEFLEKTHRLHPTSPWFYQPYKTTSKEKCWVRPDYAPKGLQAINTGSFIQAFLHEPNSRLWGWDSNYINFLKSKLKKNKRIPAYSLAIWVFRTKKWAQNTEPKDILDYFFADFNLTDEERKQLFVESLSLISEAHLFQDHPIEWSELSLDIQPPPDTGPDQGGTLSLLELKNLGPVKYISLSPARRMNIITGDNGLGKSFLLECAWWALTGSWPEIPAYPNRTLKEIASSITFELAGRTSHPEKIQIAYDNKSRSWPRPLRRPTIPGLIVYARVDGSFAIWGSCKGFTSRKE